MVNSEKLIGTRYLTW